MRQFTFRYCARRRPPTFVPLFSPDSDLPLPNSAAQAWVTEWCVLDPNDEVVFKSRQEAKAIKATQRLNHRARAWRYMKVTGDLCFADKFKVEE